jgi:hypothetical protein
LRRAYQLAQAETAKAETPSRAADLGESTSSNSSNSHEPGQSVIVKDIPELIKEWRKSPLRAGIPKWDVDD